MKKVFVLVAAFFLIASFAALAQEQAAEQPDLFTQFDADGNGALNEEEIGAAFDQYTQGEDVLGAEDIENTIVTEGYLTEWDSDADGQLNKDEFTQGVLSTFDANGNGTLEMEEMPEVQGAM